MDKQTPVTAVPFNPQTQSFTPAPVQPAIQPVTPTIPTLPQGKIPEPSPVISADNLNVKKVDVPTTTITPNVPPTQNQAQEIINQTAVQETENQKTSQSLSKSILDLIPQLQGQSQELAVQQKAQNLPALRQNLQNINSQILQKQAELNQDDIRLVQSIQNIEDKPIAMEFITGQQQSVQRNAQIARALKASEIGVLNATALGMQGNISLAEQTAKQAVETKYAPYKEALETYKLQLEALTPFLNADEKKQAREQEIKTKLAFNDIQKREKNEEASRSMVIAATQQQAPAYVIQKANDLIAKGKPTSEVAQVLGLYSGDYWGTKIKMAQFNKLMSESAKIASEVSAAGLGSTSAVNKEDQAKFLLDTIAKGKARAEASGRSSGRQWIENLVVGSTDFTNLQADVRTLKTNLLTLASDPGVKKFFGPQMTNEDVKNMMSVGTTLDPDLQDPQDLKSELVRAENIFKKFAPDYKPTAPNVDTWASNAKKFLNVPQQTNYGYTDNQNQ